MWREKRSPSFTVYADEAALEFERDAPMQKIRLDLLSALDGVEPAAAVAETRAECGVSYDTAPAHR